MTTTRAYRRHLLAGLVGRAVGIATARAKGQQVTMTQTESISTVDVSLTVNGKDVNASVDPRLLLSDFLRHELQLTGTHVGCEHGVCGCCTVHIDGHAARSCLAFVAQLDGAEVHTVESLAGEDGQLNVLQEAFRECHALQCGFCTPGFLMSISDLLEDRRART